MNQPLTQSETLSPMIFLAGQWVTEDKATLSVFDHGVLYGDGVYEGLRCYNGKIFRAQDHYQRLERSARCIDLELPYNREEIDSIIKEGIKRNKLKNAYIRIVVTRGPGPIGPDPKSCDSPRMFIIIKDIPPLHGTDAKSISAALSTVRRVSIDSATAQIKSLNYLPTVMAKIEARKMGVDDVIMLDPRGMVAEAPVANLFIVTDGVVKTPSIKSGILEGITRRVVIEMLREKGIQVIECDITPYELNIADEMFLTGTHTEIVAVGKFNGRQLGDGEMGTVTKLAREGFDEVTKR